VKVVILRAAQRDLVAIRDWIAIEDPGAAARVLDRILTGIEQLATQPRSGPVVRDRTLARRGYRCLTRERFLVFYRVKRRQIRVYRVLHGRRDWRRLV
jgi:toxin ParE1/3/4